jgi:hypothetical protein
MANQDRPKGFEPYGEVKSTLRCQAGSKVVAGELVARADDGAVDAWASGDVLGVALSTAQAAGDTVLVSDSNDQKYICQADAGDIDAQTDIGLNYDVVATAEDSTYDIARMELDSSSGATTATLPIKLVEVDKRPDNAFGANVDCIVKINVNQDSDSNAGL